MTGSRKIYSFVDKVVFSCKAHRRTVFGRVDQICTGPRGKLDILFSSRLGANDAHFVGFGTAGRVVCVGTGSFVLLGVVSDLLSHPGWGEGYFHEGALVRVVLVVGWYWWGEGEEEGAVTLAG